MDAVKFIEERNRMCKAYSGSDVSSCAECPARYRECNELNGMTGVAGTDIVNVVEKWAAAHPCKTRQSVFLEQWPNCMMDDDGAVGMCPRNVDKNYVCDLNRFAGCADCRREFWRQEVE